MINVAELRGAWLSQFATNTRDGYARDFDEYMGWLGGEIFPGDRARIQAWLGHLTTLGRASSTINRKASSVASFYQYALEEGHIDRNPAKLVRRPRRSEGQKMGLDADQALALVATAHASGPTAHALVWLMIGSALRVTEACSLNVEDIHASTTPATLTVVTKGGRTQQKPIAVPAMEAILSAVDGRSSGPLLMNRDKKRLTRHRAWELMQKITTKAGTENCTPHILRHTAASLALGAGAPIQDVQMLLGHRSIETTLRYVRNLDQLAAANNAAFQIGEILTKSEIPTSPPSLHDSSG